MPLLPTGEIKFVVVGVMLQAGSIACESVRLTLVQILLQKRGIKMNPISSLYHIAPCCFVFLALPFTYIELPKMMADPDLKVNVPLLLTSAAAAFGAPGRDGTQPDADMVVDARDGKNIQACIKEKSRPGLAQSCSSTACCS